MQKVVRYLVLFVVVVFATAVVVCLFNLKYLYRSLVLPNAEKLPPRYLQLFEKLTHQNLEKKPDLRPERTIKVLEGWTEREISQYFEREGLWQSEELLELAGLPKYDYRQEKQSNWPKDFSDQYDFLADKPKYYSLEGYLFPDTYRIYATSTVSEALDKMLDNFDKKLTQQMRSDIKQQGKTIYEIIIMASIVEKEAALDYSPSADNTNARLIAGIFWNRLEIGQALQSDATLSYYFGDRKPSHSGKQLEVDTAYNTYKYPGLPPTPICNPGILAIKAAIYPLDSDYNYFLSPLDSRQVIFSKTYEEHVANKFKYLK